MESGLPQVLRPLRSNGKPASGAEAVQRGRKKSYQQALDKDPSSTDGPGNGLLNTYFAQKQARTRPVAAANAQIAKSPKQQRFLRSARNRPYSTAKKDFKRPPRLLCAKRWRSTKNNSDALVKLGKVQIEEGEGRPGTRYLSANRSRIIRREVSFYILAGELYESQIQMGRRQRNMYQQALNIESKPSPWRRTTWPTSSCRQGGNVDVALAMAQTARPAACPIRRMRQILWAGPYFHKGVYHSGHRPVPGSTPPERETRWGLTTATIHYHLGLAYQKANQPALARQQLETRVEDQPPNYANSRRSAQSALRTSAE